MSGNFSGTRGKKKQVSTTGIQQKLNFRMFRAHKKVEDISELYQMRKFIAEGAFGKVYEAHHIRADRPVAVKIISKAKLRESNVHEKLMMQELEALDKLEHPHIVHVVDLCED